MHACLQTDRQTDMDIGVDIIDLEMGGDRDSESERLEVERECSHLDNAHVGRPGGRGPRLLSTTH